MNIRMQWNGIKVLQMLLFVAFSGPFFLSEKMVGETGVEPVTSTL